MLDFHFNYVYINNIPCKFFLIEKKKLEEGDWNEINRVDKPHSPIDYHK